VAAIKRPFSAAERKQELDFTHSLTPTTIVTARNMPLPAYSTIDSVNLGALARSKVARECNRPERDLRLLLGHIRILDVLEQSDAELSDSSEDESNQQSDSQERSGAQPQPCPTQRTSKDAEEDDLADLFVFEYDGKPRVAMAAAVISVSEVAVED